MFEDFISGAGIFPRIHAKAGRGDRRRYTSHRDVIARGGNGETPSIESDVRAFFRSWIRMSLELHSELHDFSRTGLNP